MTAPLSLPPAGETGGLPPAAIAAVRAARPLRLGRSLSIWPPVVLAPMAGVTNHPYRRICRRFGAGLCVSEMVSSRGILEGHRSTWKLAHFGPEERPRSIQIFGSDPAAMGEAARRLREELDVDHIDLNFGCPVRKVVRKGMGAAAPADAENCGRVVRAVVRAADPVPVTMKVRLGMDDGAFTFLRAGEIAEGEGCAWITLHARTARQMYSGRARWQCIRELKEHVAIPVLGNGDVFAAADAARLLAETGADGVVVGRGCLGNPWLFRDLRALFDGEPPPARPAVAQVVSVAREHYQLLRDHFGGVRPALVAMRKFGAWYAHGFPGAAEFRRRFQKVETEDELERIFAAWLGEAGRDGAGSG